MNRILLPTDFSVNASQAIDYACSYFSGLPCTFFILNVEKAGKFVLDDLMAAKPGSSVEQAIAGDNKKQLSVLVEQYRQQYSQEAYIFEPLFDFDIFVDSVNQTVKKEKIDLIVMGTNGASGAREAIFGSNTLQVIRNVNCPTLAIPSDFVFNDINQIMISVVEQVVPSDVEVALLRKFLKGKDPSVCVLSISEKALEAYERESLERKLSTLLSGYRLSYHYLDQIPVPMAINAFVQLEQIDLHALHVEKKSFLKRFIYGSTTSSISYSAEVPLLVLNRD